MPASVSSTGCSKWCVLCCCCDATSLSCSSRMLRFSRMKLGGGNGEPPRKADIAGEPPGEPPLGEASIIGDSTARVMEEADRKLPPPLPREFPREAVLGLTRPPPL